MTLLSLENACSLEQFDGLQVNKMENFEQCKTPQLPLPTEPPSKDFSQITYHWKDDYSSANQLTTNPFAGSTYNGLESQGTCSYAPITFGENTYGNNQYNVYNAAAQYVADSLTRSFDLTLVVLIILVAPFLHCSQYLEPSGIA